MKSNNLNKLERENYTEMVELQEQKNEVRNIEIELPDLEGHTNSNSTPMEFVYQSSPISNTNNTQLPPIPWKIFILSSFLTVAGIILISMGFVKDAKNSDPLGGGSFWLTGVLVLIPGIFYSVKIILAWRSTDAEERLRFLDDIPI